MIWDLIVIFLLQAVYVSIATVRWIILMRGRRVLAAVISFFELILYVVALGMVVTQLNDPLRVVVYALGYAIGSLTGSLAEERLAIGYAFFHIITRTESDVATKLRDAGLGVTLWNAKGRVGERIVLIAVCQRKLAPKIMSLLLEWDPTAFVVRTEPQNFRGGFLLKYMKSGISK